MFFFLQQIKDSKHNISNMSSLHLYIRVQWFGGGLRKPRRPQPSPLLRGSIFPGFVVRPETVDTGHLFFFSGWNSSAVGRVGIKRDAFTRRRRDASGLFGWVAYDRKSSLFWAVATCLAQYRRITITQYCNNG